MTRITQKNRIVEINNNLIIMADLVQKQILKAMDSLKNSSDELTEKIIRNDDRVDKLQQIIEEQCIVFIATEQPLAKDLRNIFAVTKVSTDLERMADYAVDICKAAGKISMSYNDLPRDAYLLWDMEKKVRSMIKMAVNAYVDIEVKEADKICRMDDYIDNMYRTIFNSMMNVIKDEEVKCNVAAQLLFVAKYLERIGDRVTNICEDIIFVKKGIYVDLNE